VRRYAPLRDAKRCRRRRGRDDEADGKDEEDEDEDDDDDDDDDDVDEDDEFAARNRDVHVSRGEDPPSSRARQKRISFA